MYDGKGIEIGFGFVPPAELLRWVTSEFGQFSMADAEIIHTKHGDKLYSYYLLVPVSVVVHKYIEK